ncbi:MAG: group II truncated hemoglobin [Myxococcota bacterium]
MTTQELREYGSGDTSFRAMGGEEGVRRLVDIFYDKMMEDPRAARIRAMHPEDLELSRDKLTVFLCGWLGGPKRYAEKWGPIRIPAAHAHLPIDKADHDAWLICMDFAIEQMRLPEDFQAYFKREIRVPADRVLGACRAHRTGE